jgi:pimeloyl-ACP methyl ester carboxylesterase
VLAVDLRGHGGSDAPEQRYTMQLLAADVRWMCAQLGVERPVVVGHSLGGLVALELAAGHREQVRAVALVDSILLPTGDRAGFVRELGRRAPFSRWHTSVARVLRDVLRSPRRPGPDGLDTRRDCGHAFACDQLDPGGVDYIVGWRWRLVRCQVPLLYLDASTPNADLARAARLRPQLVVGRTIGSGHFSPGEVPEQINAVLERFLAVGLERWVDSYSAQPGSARTVRLAEPAIGRGAA